MSDIYNMIITYLDGVYKARKICVEVGKDVDYNLDLFETSSKIMDNFANISLSVEENIKLEDYIYQRIKELKEVAHDEHDNRI